MTFENLEEEIYQLALKHPRITPPLIMRKFKITYGKAKELRAKVFLRNHLEARQMAKDIEPNIR